LKCGDGDGRRRAAGPIVRENEKILRRVNEERNIVQTVERKKANWTGQILQINCVVKHVTEGKIDGRMEVKGRRRRRCKQLLDGIDWIL